MTQWITKGTGSKLHAVRGADRTVCGQRLSEHDKQKLVNARTEIGTNMTACARCMQKLHECGHKNLQDGADPVEIDREVWGAK